MQVSAALTLEAVRGDAASGFELAGGMRVAHDEKCWRAGKRVGMAGDHPLEQIERAIEQGIVAPVLDHTAGVGHRRAVAAEQPAGVGQRQPAHDVGEVHGDLAGERDPGAAPG
jgi:hypothetical protein